MPSPLSPSVSVLRLVVATGLLGLLGLVAEPARAQEETEADLSARAILWSGLGVLELDGVEHRVPVTRTPAGALFGLPPIVELLGGELIVGPLGLSHTLVVEGVEMVFGPDSSVMTIGEEIVAIGQVPMTGIGGVEVPLELLRRSYGDLQGLRFEWLEEERRLRVDRGSGERLPVRLDWVHSQGITTLLMVFPQRPRYRVDVEGNPVRLELLGTRIDAGELPAVVDDPLIERAAVSGSVLRVFLEPGVRAAEPYEIDRPDRFELVFDLSRSARVAEPRIEPTPTDRTSDGLRVVIDPGHGGDETGAIGPSGVTEKELTLLLARRLKSRLEQRLPVQVVLTRDDDYAMPLDARTAIANQNRADLFLSLHLNSEPWSSGARGSETYFLSMEASDERAAAAAEIENRSASEVAVPPSDADEQLDLQLLLWDLAQTHHLAESQRLANAIQQELNQALDLRDRGVKQAPFRVLMGATMPAVLIELGFLSNAEEEERLRDPAYRLDLVDALVRAVQRFLAARQQQAPTAELSRP